jgi:hypothetical protein
MKSKTIYSKFLAVLNFMLNNENVPVARVLKTLKNCYREKWAQNLSTSRKKSTALCCKLNPNLNLLSINKFSPWLYFLNLPYFVVQWIFMDFLYTYFLLFSVQNLCFVLVSKDSFNYILSLIFYCFFALLILCPRDACAIILSISKN